MFLTSHLLREFEGLLGLVSHGNRSRMEESVDWGNRLTWKRVMRMRRMRRRSNRSGRTIEEVWQTYSFGQSLNINPPDSTVPKVLLD